MSDRSYTMIEPQNLTPNSEIEDAQVQQIYQLVQKYKDTEVSNYVAAS